jgi:hypothetical protein
MPTHDPTLEAIDAAIEARARLQPRRDYLGFSAIGRSEAELLRDFRDPPEWSAAVLKRFEDGHRGEAVMAERLRMVPGIRLQTLDLATGHQIEFSLLGGQFKGHADGLICGLLHDPMTPHVWEHKVCNEKKQADLARLKAEVGEANALRHWDSTYYAQAIMYMHSSHLKRHWLTCSAPGERHTIAVTTDASPEEAEELIEKARRVLQELGR